MWRIVFERTSQETGMYVWTDKYSDRYHELSEKEIAIALERPDRIVGYPGVRNERSSIGTKDDNHMDKSGVVSEKSGEPEEEIEEGQELILIEKITSLLDGVNNYTSGKITLFDLEDLVKSLKGSVLENYEKGKEMLSDIAKLIEKEKKGMIKRDGRENNVSGQATNTERSAKDLYVKTLSAEDKIDRKRILRVGKYAFIALYKMPDTAVGYGYNDFQGYRTKMTKGETLERYGGLHNDDSDYDSDIKYEFDYWIPCVAEKLDPGFKYSRKRRMNSNIIMTKKERSSLVGVKDNEYMLIDMDKVPDDEIGKFFTSDKEPVEMTKAEALKQYGILHSKDNFLGWTPNMITKAISEAEKEIIPQPSIFTLEGIKKAIQLFWSNEKNNRGRGE